eukprot:3592499-Karenia_brevis.AAC.1
MIWRPGKADSIERTFVLEESTCTKDKGLQMVSEADRNGHERWEMYWLIHGDPTCNVGSWLPGEDTPWCNSKRCGTLAAHVWPEIWRRGQGTVENWLLRKDSECGICKHERRRRCCVLHAEDEGMHSRMVEEPFASAPFVHPCRQPSRHATQLRALSFAKNRKRRLLWEVANDKNSYQQHQCGRGKGRCQKGELVGIS